MGIKVHVRDERDEREEKWLLELASENCRRGWEDGIKAFIETWNEMCREKLVSLLTEKFNMSESQAIEFAGKYWDNSKDKND